MAKKTLLANLYGQHFGKDHQTWQSNEYYDENLLSVDKRNPSMDEGWQPEGDHL